VLASLVKWMKERETTFPVEINSFLEFFFPNPEVDSTKFSLKLAIYTFKFNFYFISLTLIIHGLSVCVCACLLCVSVFVFN